MFTVVGNQIFYHHHKEEDKELFITVHSTKTIVPAHRQALIICKWLNSEIP